MTGSDSALLDNPIWNALTTDHAPLALGNGHARRYPAEIGPLSGIPNQSEASYASLASLAGQYPVVLFSLDPIRPSPGWTELRAGDLVQMVRTVENSGIPGIHCGAELRQLTPADSPAMVELAELTEPGPFRLRTHELGVFYGIFENGRLVSMAGQRMRLPGFVEISAVCTHSEARGKGYARTLMLAVMNDIRGEGDTPFLHTWAFNDTAIRVYTALGFVLRHSMHVVALRNDPA